MTYKKRSLKFQFKLKSGAFDEKGNDTLTIDNIKAEVEIGAYGGDAGTNLDARIFGLSRALMSKLSYKGVQVNGAQQNMMKVWADDQPIFIGSITECSCDFNQMPDAPLIISGFATGFDQSIPAQPFSAKGSVDAADIVNSIAKSINYVVVNNGVSFKLSNPYFDGNPVEQIMKVARACGFNVDVRIGVVFIWTQTGPVDDIKPLISKETGLIGYPVFNRFGVRFQCTFSNLIVLGRRIQLDTSLENASGNYTITSAIHHLSSWTEGGPWMSIVQASPAQLLPIRQ
ncbi:baseplate hub protein [Pantoea allii]|uniref:baseplate hub protein n=1 Tax=Pantoea allii TaxID=574096 RepID=UPI003D3232DC